MGELSRHNTHATCMWATCAVEETQACVHWQANAHYGSYKPQKLHIMALQDSDMASDWPFRVLLHLGFITLYKDLYLRNS